MGDLIDRRAAIDALKQQAEEMTHWAERYAEQRKGILTAINIVSDLPSAQPTQSNAPNTLDAISRQEAMEICRRMVWNGADDYLPMSAKAIENEIRQLPPIRVCETEPSDLISRQDALNMMWRTLYEYEDKTEKQFQKSDEISDWLINDRLWVQNGHALCVDVIASMPSAQPERLTDDDFETIRIHLNAYKENLCNQRRWKEAEEYQRIIDRFMGFASAQQEQKVKGKWIGGELGECSICGHEGCASDIWTGCEKTYCPNCGHELEGTGI